MEKIDEIKCVADYYDALGGIHNGKIFKNVIADFERLTGVKVDLTQKLPYNINWFEQGEAEELFFYLIMYIKVIIEKKLLEY